MLPDTDQPQYDRPAGLVERLTEAMCEAHTIEQTVDLPPVEVLPASRPTRTNWISSSGIDTRNSWKPPNAGRTTPMVNDFFIFAMGFVLGMLAARWLLRRDVERAEQRYHTALRLERMRAREDRIHADAMRKAGAVSREEALRN
jgi:hypothetical protein